MKAVAAIIESAVDVNAVTREILKEVVALQDDERHADEHERKSAGFRETAARRRVEIGRRLIEVKRVTKHGGWLPYLEKLGIESRNAQRWMELAGYVESKNDTRSDVSHLPTPTLADAGIDKRPRKRDEQPDAPKPARTPDPEQQPPPVLDIDRELSRIQDKLCAAASSMPLSVRKQVAHELRETARIIEEMQ